MDKVARVLFRAGAANTPVDAYIAATKELSNNLVDFGGSQIERDSVPPGWDGNAPVNISEAPTVIDKGKFGWLNWFDESVLAIADVVPPPHETMHFGGTSGRQSGPLETLATAWWEGLKLTPEIVSNAVAPIWYDMWHGQYGSPHNRPKETKKYP